MRVLRGTMGSLLPILDLDVLGGSREFEGAGEHQIDDQVPALVHDICDLTMVEIGGRESGRKIGDDRDAAIGNTGFPERDGLGGSRHPDDIGPQGAHHFDLGWRFVSRAIVGKVGRSRLNVHPKR